MDTKILQWNIRNFQKNKHSLNLLNSNIQPSIICLQETWMSEESNFRLPGYNICSRKDRNQENGDRKRGGGVAILATPQTPVRPYLIYSNLEVCAVKLYSNSQELVILSLYLPPTMPNIENLLEELNAILSSITSPYIVCADVNGHHTSWGSQTPNSRGNIINQWITGNDLALLNSMEPTYEASNGNFTHIDITTCTTNISLQFEWEVYHDNVTSDHFPIIIKASNITLPETISLPKYKIKEADWKLFEETLQLPLPPFHSPTETYTELQNKILSAANEAIPLSKGTHKPKYNKCWWTKECSEAHKKKNQALKEYRRNRGDINLWIEYKRKKAIFKHIMLEAKRTAWKNFISSLNSNAQSSTIWKKINAIRNTKSNPNIVLQDGDNFIHDPTLIAEKFATDFTNRGIENQSQVNNTSLPPGPDTPQNLPDPINNNFDIYELKRALKSGTTNTPGPDCIPPSTLKHLSEKQQKELLHIFNHFWNNGLPQQMKESTIIAIHKQNKIKTCTSSFRPISLTNTLSKIMERMVNNRLKAYLEKHNLIDPTQSGFRKGFSTYDGLARLEDHIRQNQKKKHPTLALFVDISQAFDSVNHTALIYKLQKLGLTGNILNYIKQFIGNRKIRVQYKGHYSSTYTTKLGVPQGSVVSPILFLIIIDDLLKDAPSYCQYSKFADDVAFWISHKNTKDCLERAQHILLLIEEWGKKWGFSFSHLKTKGLFFTRKKIPDITLKINNQPIELTNSHKFLGVTFDRGLTWKPHIQNVKARCQKDINLLRIISAQKWGADYLTLRRLYYSLTLSKILYASFLYDTAAKTNLRTLNTIQNSAARIMLGALRCTRAEHLVKVAQLIPLNILRKQELLKFSIRVLNNPANPFRRNITFDENPANNVPYIIKHRPISDRIRKELSLMQIQPEDVGTTPVHMKYCTLPPLASASIHDYKKSNLDSLSWNQLHDYLLSQYPNYNPIYCDGSVANSQSGCGVWNQNFAIKAKLPNNSTIFTCELYAILLAIEYISQMPGKYLILTDSLSSVEALTTPHDSNHYLIYKIAHKIYNLPSHLISIQWIPSHMGIPGNEAADLLAKEALELQNITNMPKNSKDLINHVSKTLKKKIEKTCDPCPHPTAISFESTSELPQFLLLPRRQQVTLSRLHLRVTKSTHSHIISRTPQKACHSCNQELTLDHIFIHCPLFTSQRRALIDHCNSKNLPFTTDHLFQGNFPPTILMQFIEACNLEDNI